MQAKCILILIIIMLYADAPYAGESKKNKESAIIKTLAKKTENKNNETPSMELLEFLGKWETKDGNWIDPTDLDRFIKPDMEFKNDKIKKP